MAPDTLLLLSLLRAELRNWRLIHGLEQAGLVVPDFRTDLSGHVLALAGFHGEEVDDDLFHFYFAQLEACMDLPLAQFQDELWELARGICRALSERRAS